MQSEVKKKETLNKTKLRDVIAAAHSKEHSCAQTIARQYQMAHAWRAHSACNTPYINLLVWDGHQVTVPHPPLGNRTTTVHAHLQAEKLQHKTKEFSIR